MSVIDVLVEILSTADTMVGESTLPNFLLASEDPAKLVRISSFDQLHHAFQRFVDGCDQEMHVLGHDDEGMQTKCVLASVRVDCLQKELGVIFHDEKARALKCQESDEVSAWR
jgi:hypothetical protein